MGCKVDLMLSAAVAGRINHESHNFDGLGMFGIQW